MRRFEIRSGAKTILVDAEDEADALNKSVEGGALDDGDDGTVSEYDGRPVGADGTDPEEPEPDVLDPLHDPRGPYPV